MDAAITPRPVSERETERLKIIIGAQRIEVFVESEDTEVEEAPEIELEISISMDMNL